ncbi:MAG TPA: fimbrial protein [Dyella sp.]|uniref:fimbrial protein n=1 Tax=Dyella sp. TaxID=1869338 RepID=UPI002BECBD56|nr:fimbrial protein [Dyella sp.]HUB88962.1 fimbrial protein [Dyella sp.]
MSALLLIIGLLLMAMRPAEATQSPTCNASNKTITIPTVAITPGQSNGPIGSAVQATISIDCYPAYTNTPNYYDSFNVQTGQLAPLDSASTPPAGGGILFQTNIPGIDVLLTAQTVQASSGNNGPNGTPGWSIATINCNFDSGVLNGQNCSPDPVSVTFTAQLYKTGPTTPGKITSLTLLEIFETDTVATPPSYWGQTIYYSGASSSFGSLKLNTVNVSMSTCNVAAGSTNLSVTLPTVDVNALPTTGSVAGQKSFPIQYTCPSGWALYMTMSTANPAAATGVILPSTSCAAGSPATNVGIQLLQSNQQPVQFNTAQSVGNSPNGTLNLTYYAQYYATGSPIGAGQVCGTATFTMSYQ